MARAILPRTVARPAGTGSAVSVDGGGWDRRRLLLVLAAMVITVVVLLAGLGYAVVVAVTSPSGETTGTSSSSHAGHASPAPSGADKGSVEVGRGQARRDRIAAAPMLAVDRQDSLPGEPAAVPGPAMVVPGATGAGPAGVPTGFPRTPAGAVGQLAAIEATVLQAMSIPLTNQVYAQWALRGGTGVAGWELTGHVQSFLRVAGTGQEKDLTTTVIAAPAGALVKGTDGPDWVLACVLLQVRARIAVEARMGFGHCAAMQWSDGRWMLAPGAAAARAPSTWPGTTRSVQAGWRTWVDDGGSGAP